MVLMMLLSFFPSPSFLPFPVHLIGTIQSGSGFGVKSAYVRWRILCGPDWTLLGGLHQGHSQVAKTEEVCRWGHTWKKGDGTVHTVVCPTQEIARNCV